MNNARTEGAPQQQVVNGWTAKDLLTLQVRQNNDHLELQYRQMALLLVIAMLLGWSVVSQQEKDHVADSPTGGNEPQSSPDD